MLRIKEFAKLCNCTTSILRYYDKQDILKPFYIEKVNGYRYYLDMQAFDYFRIKQLQEAGLTMKEIKGMKGKKDDEIIAVLKEKLMEQMQLVNSIKHLINTYQEQKMKIEKNIKELNELYKMTVESENHKLRLQKNQEEVILNFIPNTTELAQLLNLMQKQIVIGFDDFEDMKKYQNKLWNYTKIVSGWENKEDLFKKIENTVKPKDVCIHLFYINESIDLFEISSIIAYAESKGFCADDSLFYVSLSLDGMNSYSIIYTE